MAVWAVMSLAALILSGRQWLLPAALFLVVTLVLLVRGYLRAPGSAGLRTACLGLKLLGVLALLACLLEPYWHGQRAKPGANLFAVVADTSESLKIKDRGDNRTRAERLQELLGDGASGWQGALEAAFQVRRYVFDSRLQSVPGFNELTFEGRSSTLASSLRNLASRYDGRPLAGVLVFTDGNATDVDGDFAAIPGLPPVHPVVLGRDDPIKDLSVQKVAVSQTAFEDAPVTIQAEVSAAGYAGRALVARLVEVDSAVAAGAAPTQPGARPEGNATAETAARSAAVLGEDTQTVARDGQSASFRFQVRPTRPGVSLYELRVFARDEGDPFIRPGNSSEATLVNNRRTIVVDRGRGPYRVLYVGGRPNWEYKFLNRAVDPSVEDQIQLVALIRVARREPKFEFRRGRSGESSNPLFRGFGNQAPDEIERYDQPVLIRLNTRDEQELRGGFPKTVEDLFAYHAVIIDDLEAEFFTREQMSLLQKFVSERGGGFLMLGGQESFRQGHYANTPIGTLLPVYVDRAISGEPVLEARLALTREGWLQPWMRLRGTEGDERSRIDTMLPFQVVNRVRDIKPGASVMATVLDAHDTMHPALVVQRYGLGRSAALLIGDLWRWGMRDESERSDFEKAWRQLLRWLVADVPNRFTFEVEPDPTDANQAVRLQVRARDKEFKPLDNATVTFHVRPAGHPAAPAAPAATAATAATAGKPTTPPADGVAAIRLTAEPSLTEPGVYRSAYVPRVPGGYLAEATVAAADGVEVGRTEAGWVTDFAFEEFQSLKPNRSLLEQLAKATGGELLTPDQLAGFVRGLPARKAPITENWSHPLWHTPLMFLFALGCFIAEWGLRRWKGLA